VAFSIPYRINAVAAIEVARVDATQLAREAGLGFYDPQTGETIM
jgi:hypothetical protein